MAVTVTKSETMIQGNKVVTRGTIAFDASYPDGGEAITARQCGLGTFDDLQVAPTLGRTFEWDASNLKVKVFPAVNLENLSSITARFQATGT